MEFVITSHPIAAVLWACVYALCLLCALLRNGALVAALGCGAMTVAAVAVTLVCGASLDEVALYLVIFVVLCLTARGVKREF